MATQELMPDFEELYRGGQLIEGVDLDTVPWDIAAPQPIVVELEGAGLIESEVLDVGCGLGDNVLFLAERGYRVTGVDFAPTAVRKARERALERALDATFLTADATTLDGVAGPFATVLDCALYHCLDDGGRIQYIAALRRVCPPGAQLHLLCFSEAGPFPVSQESLRETVSEGWNITGITQVPYPTSFTKASFRAVAEGLLVPDVDTGIAELEAGENGTWIADENGRLTMPFWYLTAERA